MSDLTGWTIALIVLGCIAAFFALIYCIYLVFVYTAPARYAKLISHNTTSIDDFVGSQPSARSCLKVVTMHNFGVGSKHVTNRVGLALKAEESDKVPGLKVTTRNDSGTPIPTSLKPPLVVGTIRMGFGHHRIAYAATSWGIDALNGNRDTYFHDFLNIKCPESTLIHETDQKYSKGSRMASEMGGRVEQFWGSLTKSGDEDSLRVTYQMAEQLRPVMLGLDKRSPIVASHSLVAAAAVAAGFTNVINLVIDNYAQWFVVVPGALNLVQGPSNYHAFLRMGVPPSQLQLAGHWIPKDLVEGIPSACARRTKRAGCKPLRLLIPVGGAGAQRKFVSKLIRALSPLVKAGKVQLFLNAGDHVHMRDAFIEALTSSGLEYDTVGDMTGVRAFKDALLESYDVEPKTSATLFSFTDYFTAVATTDILCNVADVLTCKPSELAFYPIPKLMIRRVGDHEAYSALRASELGDGTLEAREVEDALAYVELMMKKELLTEMNASIVRNNTIGVYDGCKNAIRIALERAEAAE
eukprot:CAMPEP_0194398272 /NCGR_PEP_ID=MMETSP0174-20130528/126010_1 /TAXON_ID=216777 /ORGANISM="Proboscia alata, Strain PI-D3" /LENGTH=523 /DNA_ID=CAMNT_0039194547 /DNA_START=110 /DNA_END=1681 /DNA_ORIENTATION=+